MSNVPYYLPKVRQGIRIGDSQVVDGLMKVCFEFFSLLKFCNYFAITLELSHDVRMVLLMLMIRLPWE